jgi:hypothetical protein
VTPNFLLCLSACADPSRCHRTLLQELIEAAAKDTAAQRLKK